MTGIINLRQVRKQRDRNARRKKGNENAAKFGESASTRRLRLAEAKRAGAQHDGHRIEDAPACPGDRDDG